MNTAQDYADVAEDVFWRGITRLKVEKNTVSFMVENWENECGDDPFAYEFDLEINDDGEGVDLGVSPMGGSCQYGGGYEKGLDTPSKFKWALECAYDHSWRNWY